MSAVRVAALIPAFNEAATIGAVVSGLRGTVAEILVVDDGSTDDTARRARDGGQIGIVRLSRSRGYDVRTSIPSGVTATVSE